MNVRLETIKLEENIRVKLLDITLGDDLRQPKQVGPQQTKRLLHSKGNHQQKEKATYGMGENICKSCIWQGVNIQNI